MTGLELGAYAAAVGIPVVIGAWRSMQPAKPLELPARDSGVLDAGTLCRLGQRTETGAGIVTGQRARSR
jgi:hypothetical protein